MTVRRDAPTTPWSTALRDALADILARLVDDLNAQRALIRVDGTDPDEGSLVAADCDRRGRWTPEVTAMVDALASGSLPIRTDRQGVEPGDLLNSAVAERLCDRRGERLGLLVVCDEPQRSWSDAEVGRVQGAAVAISAMLGLDSERGVAEARLAEQVALHDSHRSAVEQTQLRAAATLQRSLLPPRVPDLEGFEIAPLYNSATDHTRVGGDWYDIVEIDETTTGFVVGDVAGHDIRSAAIMGQLRHVLASQLRDRRSPAGALAATDRYFADLDEEVMATAVVVVVDRKAQTSIVSLAGHPPPVVISAEGDAALIDARVGPPLGFGFEGHRTTPLDLSVGDTLVAYTDGVVERRSGDLRQNLRLFETVMGGAGQSVEDLVLAIDAHSRTSELVDDVAALVVRIAPTG